MELPDFTNLRPAPDPEAPGGFELIKIPLNGEVYYAMPTPPANSTLAAVGNVEVAGELAGQLAAAQTAAGNTEALAELAIKNPVLMVKLSTMQMGHTERAVKFLQDVLEPASAIRFAANMRPPDPPDMARVDDPAYMVQYRSEWEAQARRQIGLAQVLAVYQALQAHYTGRPTGPSSSSSDGHGGTGDSSTAGALAEV